ncbi:MAG: alpha/beta hydrolase [Gammaproteobacteria bacterium]|nr:alpha/beta hydrolase [Gammaproteobacteria bacterium]
MISLLSAAAHSSCVILLHGLARSESSMEKLEHRLFSEGYNTVNLGYPSRDHSIEVLAQKAITPALKECQGSKEVNFVTHSLGGILVRQYLSIQEIPNLKYVVMLGPPNKGSEIVDKLHSVPGFHFVNGDAGLQLGTGELSIPKSLGMPRFNVGIIAGNKSINWILSSLIPGSDDGKVSIERTKLKGMSDHIELPVTHPFMMKNEKVISQVIYYLENGEFERNSSHNKSSKKDTLTRASS